MEEAQGIYRGEVMAMMATLADINVNVKAIRDYVEGEDEEEEEEGEGDLPDP